LIAYTLNFRSSRAPGALRAPGETSGLHGFRTHSQVETERKKGGSESEGARKEEVNRERERYKELDREGVKERREIGDR
jgi:hypothetical protein